MTVRMFLFSWMDGNTSLSCQEMACIQPKSLKLAEPSFNISSACRACSEASISGSMRLCLWHHIAVQQSAISILNHLRSTRIQSEIANLRDTILPQKVLHFEAPALYGLPALLICVAELILKHDADLLFTMHGVLTPQLPLGPLSGLVHHGP